MKSDVSEVRGCLCLDTRRAARHLTQLYDEALRPSGLRVTQFQLLAAVSEAQPVTQQTLSELMGMDRTTLTRNLSVLERDGLVAIELGPTDRREHLHRLTTQGREAVANAMPLWRAIHTRLLKHVTGTGQGSQLKDIRRLLGSLDTFTG